MKWLVVAAALLLTGTAAGAVVLAEPFSGTGGHAGQHDGVHDATVGATGCGGASSWSGSVSGTGELPDLPEQAACGALPNATFREEVDLLALQDGHSIALVAFRAVADLTFRSTTEQEIHVEGADTVCSEHASFARAPVDALRAAAAGEDVPAPEHAGGGSGGSGASGASGGGPGQLQVAGQRVGPTLVSGSSAMGGGSGEEGELLAGEWILVQAGLAGADPATFHADDFWTLTVEATAEMERMDLPSVGFLCGFGFGGLGDATLSAPSLQVGGHAGFTGYAATAVLTHLVPPQAAQGSGRLLLAGEEVAFDGTSCIATTAWGQGDVAIEVDQWQGEQPFWVLSGAWRPATLVPPFC